MGSKDKAKSKQREDKKYKPRDKDPVKLVMERGSNVIIKKAPVVDDNGVQQKDEDGLPMFTMTAVPKPMGVVLAPVQTMLLAGYIQTRQKQIDALTELLRMYEMDEDIPHKTLGATESPQESDADAVDNHEDSAQGD